MYTICLCTFGNILLTMCTHLATFANSYILFHISYFMPFLFKSKLYNQLMTNIENYNDFGTRIPNFIVDLREQIFFRKKDIWRLRLMPPTLFLINLITEVYGALPISTIVNSTRFTNVDIRLRYVLQVVRRFWIYDLEPS